MQGLTEILDDLLDYVQFQKDAGLPGVEASPDLLRELSAMAASSGRSAAPRLDRRPAPSVRRTAVSSPAPVPSAVPPTEAVKGPPVAGSLDEMAAAVAQCTKCSLHKTRTRTVPGQGCGHPDIMFIGEAPGADEDKAGLAFVGAAGKLLTRMIEAMGYTREQVFIGNILKCRPPNNRTPMPDEMETCLPYLKAQIAILKPRVIIALGATAVKGLLDPTASISRLRGTWRLFEGIQVMPTYHPAYLLRNPSAKHEVWEDLKAVLKFLGKEPPQKYHPS